MTKPTAFDTALDALRRHVLEHDLQPGDALPPVAELAHTIGVSQATLREALRAWEAAGIVEIRHGVGAFVRAYNYASLLANLSFSGLFEPEQQRHMAELRLALELGVLPEALERIGPDVVDALDALVEAMPGAQDGLDAEFRFHATLCGVLRNPLIDGLFRLLWLSLEQQRRTSQGHRMPPRMRYALHVELVEALRRRDLAGAQGALRRYLALAREEGPGA